MRKYRPANYFRTNALLHIDQCFEPAGIGPFIIVDHGNVADRRQLKRLRNQCVADAGQTLLRNYNTTQGKPVVSAGDFCNNCLAYRCITIPPHATAFVQHTNHINSRHWKLHALHWRR